MIQDNLNLKAKGRIWIETAEGKFIGTGKIELMEKIKALGSIRQAAIEMEMSYRKAWGLIEQMNAMAGTPLVISQRGGKGGGKAIVTEAGEKYIFLFKTFHQNFQAFLATQNEILNQLES